MELKRPLASLLEGTSIDLLFCLHFCMIGRVYHVPVIIYTENTILNS